jgi:hypothetical protein|tara:strand:- start:631 stop:1074 length:444 start_codon:yes stop_codon:yes gene_type:complete
MDEKGANMKLNMEQFVRLAGKTIEPNFDKYPQDRDNKNKITFNDNICDGEQSMNCPICGFECTHITGVEVFSRGEDAEEHVHTTVDMREMSTKTETVKGHGRNPSGRRDGVILSGYCETGCKFEIEIAQHKGNTFFKSNKTGTKNLS